MGQLYLQANNFGNLWIRGKFSEALTIPIYDTLPDPDTVTNSTEQEGLLVIRGSDDTLHWYSNGAWHTAGSTARCGTATLVGGLVTVSTSEVNTGDIIYLSVNDSAIGSGTVSIYSAPSSGIVDGVSFNIKAYDPLTSGTNTTDGSSINWRIETP